MRRLLDIDPMTGIATYHHYDWKTDTTAIETVQDVEPILEMNKALQNSEELKTAGIKQSWWRVASIPIVIQEKWMRENGINIHNRNHWPGVKNLLNSSEYAYLRTSLGKV